jgi:membrane protease YdiL (CAAX protease family)
MVAAVVVVLVAANVLNNRVAPGAYLVTCAAGAVLVVVLARRDRCSWTALGLGRATARRGLRWGGAAIGVVFLGYTIAALIPATRAAFSGDDAARLAGSTLAWNALVKVPLGTVLLEETAFRGALYAMLARRYGVRRAIIGSSALFGLWHVLPALGVARGNAAVARIVGSGPAGTAISVVGVVAGTALAGVVFCELRRRSGSLLAPMGLHWALNGLGFAFVWAVSAATT